MATPIRIPIDLELHSGDAIPLTFCKVMKPLLSEFSYGYALTEELVSGAYGGIVGAPVFPTQNQEGVVGGYDVEIPYTGVPIFLQFKLSHWLMKRSANEYSWFNRDYYRMHLRPSRFSDQHQLMIDWENLGNDIFYVAPEFHKQDELNSYYTSRSVVAHSAFFSPNDLGPLPDRYDHYVVFAPGSPTAWFCSGKPRETKRRFRSEEFSRYFSEVIDTKKRRLTQDALEEANYQFLRFLDVREKEIGALKRFEDAKRQAPRRTRKDAALFLSYLARTYLDSELVILSDEPNTQQAVVLNT